MDTHVRSTKKFRDEQGEAVHQINLSYSDIFSDYFKMHSVQF